MHREEKFQRRNSVHRRFSWIITKHRKRYRLLSNKDFDLARREETLRGTIRSVSLSSDFIKRNTGATVGCDAQSAAPVGVAEGMKEFSNLFGAIRLKVTAGNTRHSWAMLHFRPHLIFYRTNVPRARDALSRRSRSRHLLLALFFPATEHLHNYNLTSAVSKTRAARFASTVYIRFWACYRKRKKGGIASANQHNWGHGFLLGHDQVEE